MIYGIAEAGSDCIKIGYTHTRGETIEPRAAQIRLSELQCGNHRLLEIVAACAGTRDIEQALHIEFARHRVSGEWFRCAGTVLEWSRANAIDIARTKRSAKRWTCLACTKRMVSCMCGLDALPSRI